MATNKQIGQSVFSVVWDLDFMATNKQFGQSVFSVVWEADFTATNKQFGQSVFSVVSMDVDFTAPINNSARVHSALYSWWI